MRTIIKNYTDRKFPSEIFSLNQHTIQYGGSVSENIFISILTTGILKEVDQLEIIEIFWRHSILTKDCKFCKYYEIKQNAN